MKIEKKMLKMERFTESRVFSWQGNQIVELLVGRADR